MQYDKEFKLQALELSDDIGVKKAAEQLGIPYFTLAEWRSIRKHRGTGAFVGSGHQSQPLSDRIFESNSLKQNFVNLSVQMKFLRKLWVFSPRAERSKNTPALRLHLQIQ